MGLESIDWNVVIVSGIAASASFEIIKTIFLRIKNKFEERSLPFNITGYWCNYQEQKSRDGFVYTAHELIVMKHRGEKLHFKLYQLTNDNRRHLYKGIGFIRGNKISLAYEEVKKARSNHTGTFNLRVQNIREHSVQLAGQYAEFLQEGIKCECYNYVLEECNITIWDKFLVWLLKSRYTTKLMSKESFVRENKAHMQ